MTHVDLPELSIQRSDWVMYESLEEASSDYIAGFQDTQQDMLEESLRAYSAVRSGVGRWGTKEEILKHIGNLCGSARTTMNLRYKVGAVFPRDTWLEDSQVSWSHYRVATKAAELDDPDSYSKAHDVLCKAADENMSVRHLEHYIAQQKRENGEDDSSDPNDEYPVIAANAVNCILWDVSTGGKVIIDGLPDAVVADLKALGKNVPITLTLSYSKGLLHRETERELVVPDDGDGQRNGSDQLRRIVRPIPNVLHGREGRADNGLVEKEGQEGATIDDNAPEGGD